MHQDIIKAIQEDTCCELTLVRVNYFAILFQELGCEKYKIFFHDLQNNIANDMRCKVFEIGYNIFYIFGTNITDEHIKKIVHQHGLDHKIYLSVDTNHMTLSPDDKKQDFSYIKYNMLAGLDMDEHSKDIKKIHHLHCATHEKRLSLALQPVVDRNYQIYFYESLLRTDCDLFASTAEIINIAEKMNFTTFLDMQVLGIVVSLFRKNPNMMLSMNVSAHSIQDLSWSKQFLTMIKQQNISGKLIVEITETGSKRNYTKIIKFIEALHELDIKVAIDDFGAGYTSFVQLQSFKVDFVKIDGFFIQNIIYDRSSVIFVQTIIEMAHALGIKVVAECVESEEIATALIELGADYLQGYYLGKPHKV